MTDNSTNSDGKSSGGGAAAAAHDLEGGLRQAAGAAAGSVVGQKGGALTNAFSENSNKRYSQRVAGDYALKNDRNPDAGVDEIDITKRRQAFNDVQKKMRNDEAAEMASGQEGGSGQAGFNAPETSDQFNANYKRFGGITDKADYMSCTNKMTDKQLERAILKGGLERGWKTLYFYKGGNLDPELTQRAQSMVSKMSRPDGEFGKRGLEVDVSTSRMAEVEPWKVKYPGRQKLHTLRDAFNGRAPARKDRSVGKRQGKSADKIASNSPGIEEHVARSAGAPPAAVS